MTDPWYVRLCVWLAIKGGWQPPASVPVRLIQPDPAIVAERNDLQAQLKAFAGVLHVKDVKLQMRDAKVHEYENSIVVLERDLAHARANTTLSFAPALNGTQFERVKTLVREASAQSIGGEAKRHAVYARLLKEYPTASKRDLGLAIEVALIEPPKEG